MRILGIDPGTLKLGWGVIDDGKYIASGVLIAPPSEHLDQRMNFLARGIFVLVDQHKPYEIAIEKHFIGKYATAAMALGEIRGMIKQIANAKKIPYYDYEPALVKRSLGPGNASKTYVSNMVRVILELGKTPESDEGDALAVALCHANRAHRLEK